MIMKVDITYWPITTFINNSATDLFKVPAHLPVAPEVDLLAEASLGEAEEVSID